MRPVDAQGKISDRLSGAILCAAPILLSGCAAQKSYMGIDLTGPVYAGSGEAPVPVGEAGEPSDPARAMPAPTTYSYAASAKNLPLKVLARRAQAGVKAAQLELGIRFEEGRGVERDLGKARALYRLAASTSGGQIWIYSPPVGNGSSGRVIPVNTGPKQVGLAEAKRRLEAVE